MPVNLDKHPTGPVPPNHGLGATNSGEGTGGLLVGRLLIVNPMVPTPMDVVAALVGLAITLLMPSVLVAVVVRVTRRRREPPSTSTTGVGR